MSDSDYVFDFSTLSHNFSKTNILVHIFSEYTHSLIESALSPKSTCEPELSPIMSEHNPIHNHESTPSHVLVPPFSSDL